MPLKIEKNLEKEAKKHGYKRGSVKYDAYVYGTLNKIERRKKQRGRREQSRSKGK